MPRSTTVSASGVLQKRHSKRAMTRQTTLANRDSQKQTAPWPMIFEGTSLGGAYVVDLEPRRDDRGFFARAFCEREFAAHGLPTGFPQSNLSRNTRRRTLRGMHYNAAPHRESKLVRCVAGAIYDVIVDLRDGSPTRLGWFGIELTAENGR